MSLPKFALPILIVGLSSACSNNTKFKGSADLGTATRAADAQPEPEPAPMDKASLNLILPSHEIRSGKKMLQTVVMLENADAKDVTWKIESAVAGDYGTIDNKGLYLSPDSLDQEVAIVITASLKSDGSVTDSETLRLIPSDSIFIGCSKGSEVFPIQADVYRLPRDTQKLPDFKAIANDKLSTVCMDQYNVAERSFTDGFPGVEDLYEWFALHTTGKILIQNEGNYRFRMKSDDGSKLWIDGSLVVDHDGLHSPTAKEGSITLKPGLYDFVLDYYQGPADRIALELFWQVPGASEFTLVPTEAFQK